MDKTIFPGLLNKLLTHQTFLSKIPVNIKNGFKATNLYPLNKAALLKRLKDTKSSADLINSPPPPINQPYNDTTSSSQVSSASEVPVNPVASSPHRSGSISAEFESPLVSYLKQQRFAKCDQTEAGKEVSSDKPRKITCARYKRFKLR
jgi:hypothetical protein